MYTKKGKIKFDGAAAEEKGFTAQFEGSEGGGTAIEANVPLSGSEDALTSLKLGEGAEAKTFKVPQPVAENMVVASETNDTTSYAPHTLPLLTSEQCTAVYNAMVLGKHVVIQSSDDHQFFEVINAYTNGVAYFVVYDFNGLAEVTLKPDGSVDVIGKAYEPIPAAQEATAVVVTELSNIGEGFYTLEITLPVYTGANKYAYMVSYGTAMIPMQGYFDTDNKLFAVVKGTFTQDVSDYDIFRKKIF